MGRRLVQRLRQTAIENGIVEFVAEVLAGNIPAFRLLRQLGPTDVRCSGGVCEVRIDIR